MSTLKYEITLNGNKEVAYVDRENENNFLEKHQNNFPKLVVNTDSIDFDIKPSKKSISELDPTGTSRSQITKTDIDIKTDKKDISSEVDIDIEEQEENELEDIIQDQAEERVSKADMVKAFEAAGFQVKSSGFNKGGYKKFQGRSKLGSKEHIYAGGGSVSDISHFRKKKK